MVDLYTKAVLTVIGIALCILVAQSLVPRVSATSPGNCGSHSNPCHVKMKVELPHEEGIPTTFNAW